MSEALNTQEPPFGGSDQRLVGRCVTASGMAGICVFDDGGDSVVVEFNHEVPHNGFPCNNPRQAWFARIHVLPNNSDH